jgi:hypothetical protein
MFQTRCWWSEKVSVVCFLQSSPTHLDRHPENGRKGKNVHQIAVAMVLMS